MHIEKKVIGTKKKKKFVTIILVLKIFIIIATFLALFHALSISVIFNFELLFTNEVSWK